jgi:hypothetical protein
VEDLDRTTLTIRRAAALAPLLMVSALGLMASGCNPVNQAVWIRNDSGRDWLVRVPGYFADGAPLVVSVLDGAYGTVYLLPRDQTVTMELLELDCTVIGPFAPVGNAEYQVQDIAGPTVTVVQRAGRSNVPEIEEVAACGGHL